MLLDAGRMRWAKFIDSHDCRTLTDVVNELLSEMRSHADVDNNWDDYKLKYMYDGLFGDPDVAYYVKWYLRTKSRGGHGGQQFARRVR